ncbi:chalcone and stilbene synthase, N-terminal domain protein [Mycobacterium kansasii]|uniref:Chalcone and stilbene synthase, N-terminal domain protein n=1 Tax=Mycobacterium kansasii TaxID=1768 RepID=A0A1V3WL91_MYCKA|nr:chalcone and stilbene synthase, N-terminal domain protein [Mycobacterium kansasii]OOK84119.1 chalcone and stilbene synthase, N-terminal domain protein [Mycobacterium kansasii]
MVGQPVSLIDVSSYLPGEPIGADYYAQFAESDDLRDSVMFRAPAFRHHVAPDETAVDMVERAAQGLIERHGEDVIETVDILITHTQAPDVPFYGAGGGIAHRLGMRPSWVLDLHNGGCAAFVLALNVARQLLTSGAGRTALIAIAQNAAGQVFDQPGVRRKSQAAVPGDGAAVGLVALSDRSPILGVECRTYGEYAGEMTLAPIRRASGGSPEPASSVSGSPRARSPRCWPAATGRFRRWRWPCAIESTCPPRTSIYWSPISPTGCSCATGAKHSNLLPNGTSTPSTRAETCSAPGFRSTWIGRSRPGG